MQSSLVIPTALSAIGMFLLSIGGDALKVAPAGIHFLPVEWLIVATTLSYRVVSYALVVLGFGVLIVAAGICRRADKRVEAALPGIAPRRSFRFAIVPGRPNSDARLDTRQHVLTNVKHLTKRWVLNQGKSV